MAEYIERESAIERLEKLFQLQAQTAMVIIEAIPAADVMLVVRCQNCEYWDMDRRSRYGEQMRYCPMVDMETRDNWFCAYGKRKEDTTCT